MSSYYYKTFSLWVRLAGWVTSTMFIIQYVRMLTGDFEYGDWSQVSSYFAEQVTMIGWSVAFWKDYRGKPQGNS